MAPNFDLDSGIKSRRRVFAIDKIALMGGAWIPQEIRERSERSFLSGKELVIRDKVSVLSFKPIELTGETFFEPFLPPGTFVFRAGFENQGGQTDMIGGDIRGVVNKLRARDFSIFEEQTNDLSKP